MNEILSKALQENKIELAQEDQQKLIRYLELLKTWNRVFNLTSMTKPHDMVYLHIIDSLVVSPFLYGTNLLDVGSGAGLPGIPLAIQNPHQHWVLLDKNNKKTRFLTQVVAELGLTNVNIEHSRCEDFHRKQCFDSILSRAFGTISMFVNAIEHLLCPNGLFIAMKGKQPQEELDALPNRFSVQKITRLTLKGIKRERHLVCIKKS